MEEVNNAITTTVGEGRGTGITSTDDMEITPGAIPKALVTQGVVSPYNEHTHVIVSAGNGDGVIEKGSFMKIESMPSAAIPPLHVE